MVAGGRLKGAGTIGVRVGKVANKYKVAKHFELAIDGHGVHLRGQGGERGG